MLHGSSEHMYSKTRPAGRIASNANPSMFPPKAAVHHRNGWWHDKRTNKLHTSHSKTQHIKNTTQRNNTEAAHTRSAQAKPLFTHRIHPRDGCSIGGQGQQRLAVHGYPGPRMQRVQHPGRNVALIGELRQQETVHIQRETKYLSVYALQHKHGK